MCRPVTLHHTDQGYISWCESCNHFNIAFGTIVFVLDPQQFESFSQTVNLDVMHFKNKVCCHEKSIMYHTGNRLVNIVLCYNELLLLADMINQSDLIYKAHRILNGNR